MGRTRALRNVKEVELEGIPNLAKCSLVTAFKCVESVKMENVSKLGEMEGLKECMMKEREKEEKKRKEEEEQRRKEEEEEKRRREIEEAAKRKAVIGSVNDWNQIDKTVGVIVVGGNCCNEKECSELDLSVFVNLRELKSENECFMFVNEVKIIGLNELKSVEIGMNSFTKKKNDGCYDPSRHFYLKNCPKLKSLKMGRYSFSDYGVIEIENVDALEVIELGDLNEWSYNFAFSSLELKSVTVTVK